MNDFDPRLAPLKAQCAAELASEPYYGYRLPASIVRACNAWARSGQPSSLLEVARLLESLGIAPDRVFDSYVGMRDRIGADWPLDAVWPFFAAHPALVGTIIGQSDEDFRRFDRSSFFAAIAAIPVLPDSIRDMLYAAALGDAKLGRLPAQRVLAERPGAFEKALEALAGSKADARQHAAQWLGRMGRVDAVAPLEQAVRKEKQDGAKGAMLDALQRLGRPVEQYLDRAALDLEAVKAMAKGVPEALAWFPWDGLPALHWADGAAVARATVQHLLAQAVRAKSPEPNAVLRKYCAMFDPAERAALGQFVLEAWLAEDTRPVSQDVGEQAARERARLEYGWSSSYGPEHPRHGFSEERMYSHFLPICLRQPAGSAIASKGVLALVAACAGEGVAAPVARYLKQYYGTRAAHGKALIAMLAWVEHPAATQLMIALGKRFRTKGFQEEATRQAEALAERKGWSVTELADRTIPTAGLDEDATLELGYGERSFSARLLPDLKLELLNEAGKVIATLPEPRQDDDPDIAKASKQALAAARKDIKGIVAAQSERLYEAYCTQRSWHYPDWHDYLLRHPLMRRLVQRLVWIDTASGQSFRPLDDGSLSDAHDGPVLLAADAQVALASDGTVAAGPWLQHLADYAVTPLFAQLGKPGWQPAQPEATAIEDFKGHMIDAFKLRARATKLGYVKGDTEGGGYFYCYEKHFPSIGLTAYLNFSGNFQPEENRKVALVDLALAPQGAGRSATGSALGKLPPVLLAECYHDLRQIAADGNGYDANWIKLTNY